MNDLFRRPTAVSSHWASFENPDGSKDAGAVENQGAKGHAFDSIAAGEETVLLHVHGSGVIRRLWLTLRQRLPQDLRAYRLDMYWDGAEKAAVSAPLGDFFCAGLGLVAFESALFASPEGQSFICTVPMPFRTEARITLTNESAHAIPHLFYDINYTLGDEHTADTLYFHAHWRRERPTTLARDFELLPRVLGSGRFLGAYITVITDPLYEGSWWGEGGVKIYLDNDGTQPTLVGTGTGDYIGTGWGQGTFVQQHQGSLLADTERGWYAFYRWHLPDPVFFHEACGVTVQQMGGASRVAVAQLLENGAPLRVVSVDGGGRSRYRNLLQEGVSLADTGASDGDWCIFFRQDDWAAVAYFYLNRPVSDLPALAPVTTRTAALQPRSLPKAAVPAEVRRSFYVPQSLRAKRSGFAFNVQNTLGGGALVSIQSVAVDGEMVDLGQVRLVSMHGVRRQATAITAAAPLLFPLNTTLRVQVNGRVLAPGSHTLHIGLLLQGIPGVMEVEAVDQLGWEE